ncbi:ubiquitin C-terminal hydrolase 12-like [Syzygium oleosum]|uniref:ubiquitin C-terminal hydrolase 12-like n=1 Tax=Syzygium oleosum TaxID=219896 RepID=UPI0024B889DE|nr:ubiquitin C-terminal hydrolase 12-like [Syzygium oleosum]
MDEEAYGITTEIREVPPAQYVFKIESFSLLSKNNIDVYETNEFEAGDQKWRLILYPKGDKSRNGGDHLSIYLAISKSTPLKVGSEINATVRFFVLDRIRDQYLTKQGRATRFHVMQSQWGIPRFMPLATFTDPSNGYLIDDTCVFGVEIVVIKNSGLGECFTPIEGRCGYIRGVIRQRGTKAFQYIFVWPIQGNSILGRKLTQASPFG